MQPPPEKICRAENEAELEKRKRDRTPFQKQESPVALGELFNFLMLRKAFGDEVSYVAGVSAVMYHHSPPNDQGTKTLPEKQTRSRDSYGTNRIENLKKGGFRCTSLERQWLHWAFVNATNELWGDVINPDQLTELPLAAVFELGFASGLPWPDDLECSIALKALAAQYPSNLSIEPKNWRSKLGSNQKDKRDNLVYDQPIPILTIGHEYLLEVSGIENPEQSTLFIFETSDRAMKVDGGEELLELFVTGLSNPNGENVEITSFSSNGTRKMPFKIQRYLGGFTYYALVFPRSWNFEEMLGSDKHQTKWNSQTTQNFLRNLHILIQQHPNTIQLASYAYEVA